MQLVQWRQPERELSKSEVDDFYHRPLSAPTLFKFKTAKLELPAHSGAFSLKLVLSGKEEYQIGQRRIELRPGQFLFLNAEETYSSRISSETESISIFLPEAERLSAVDSIFGNGADALDQKSFENAYAEAPQITYTPCDASRKALAQLLRVIEDLDNEEHVSATQLFVADAMRSLFRKAPPFALRDYMKNSTRDELMQRLVRAKSLIDETRGQQADLDVLAHCACLSKYYFLRLFGETFGASPGAYARRLRLEHAVTAIKKGEHPKKAARQAGYEDLRAFRRACQRCAL